MADAPEIQVVDFRMVKQYWDERLRIWIKPGIVYVGRYNKHYNLPASSFANPYSQANTPPGADLIGLFRKHLEAHPELVARAKRELKGMTIACWCRTQPRQPGEPPCCHADILKEIVES